MVPLFAKFTVEDEQAVEYPSFAGQHLALLTAAKVISMLPKFRISHSTGFRAGLELREIFSGYALP